MKYYGRVTILVGTVLLSWPALAQKTAERSKLEIFTGCVTPSTQDKGKLVLRSKESCSELAGNLVSASKLAGHTVTLEGALAPASGPEPETLTVSAVKQVGEACSSTCSLEPPGSRGLGKKKGEAIDKIGGTPGNSKTEPTKDKAPH